MAGKKRPPAEETVAIEDEEAFPRGGRDDLTPLEKRQLSQQAEADFKQEQQADAAGGKPKKKAKHSKEQDAEGAFFSRSAAAGKVQHVEQLKYKTLTAGMKLWGCVLEVAPEGLTVSLPHGLRGSVAPADASDVLSLLLDPSSSRGAALRSNLPHGEVPNLQQLFSVGQYVRCVIKALQDGEAEDAETAAADAGAGGARKSKGSKRIVLSLRLKSLLGSTASSSADGLVVGQVVPAVVRTVEDRGYSLSFGIKGVSAFLPAKDYQTYYPDSPLLPGSLLDVIISKAPAAAGGVYQVSVSYDAVSGGQLQPWDGLNMASLLPGWLVSCKIRQVCADGVLVSFGGYFHASIDHFHLGNPIPEEDWQKRYPVGQKLQARLIYIDPASKRIGLSCLPHLINCRLPTAVPAMGQVFDSAVVARIDSGLGLLLRLPTEPEPAVGFAHISNLADGKLEKAEIAKRFSVGATVRGRVIGFRLMDALVAMSLRQSVLAQQVYSVKDLYPGQLLDVTVLDHTSAGLVVQITPNLKGLVPKTHMTDAGVLAEGAKLPSKLKPGKTLQARVLSVDAVHKRVQLTLKKGLLGSKLPVLCDLRQATVGMKLHGVVTGVQKFGVFVGFYGGVSGLMPKANLDMLPGQEPGDMYNVGQLLRVQVASVDLRKGGLVLKPSVKHSADAEEQAPAAAAAGDPWGGLAVGSLIAAGSVVQQVLIRTPEQGGGLIELAVTGADGQALLAHLPAAHLSDHPGGVEGLISVLKPGMTLPGPLLVVQQRMLHPHAQGSDRWQADAAQDPNPQDGGQGAEGKAPTPLLLVSRKGLMVAAADKLPSSVSEVVAGAVLPGYVASISQDAVFVRFLGRCTGRAGLPQLADTFVTDPARHFTVGQSVMAAVVAIEDGKFAVSLKPSVVGSHEGKFLASLMSDLELAYQLSQAAEAAAAAAAEAGSDEDAAEAGSDEDAAAEVDWSLFPIGKTVGATVNELKEYGAVMDLEDNLDVVGLIVPEHGGNAKLQGAGRVEPCVLDVHKTQGLVELSLLPELTHWAAATAAAAAGSSKKASKSAAAATTGDEQQQPAVGSEVQAMIHFIKDHYVVASIVQQQQQKGKKAADSKQQQQYKHSSIAFIARGDYNSQGSAGREARRFAKGQIVAARVAAAAAPGNGGRVLLELAQPLLLPAKGTKGTAAAGAAAANGTSKPSAGSLVTATVVAVHDLELECAVGKAGTTAHLHVAECQERLSEVPKPHNPLSQYRVQQQITAAWLGHVKGLGHKRGKEPQLSVRPSAVAAAKTQGTGPGAKLKIAAVLSAADLHQGLKVIGWVCGFTKDALWLSLAPELKGRVHVLESGDKPQALAVDLESRFSMGQALEAVVLGVDPKHHTLDLSLRADRLRRAVADPAAAGTAAAAAAEVPEGGALVPGRIVSVSGSGVVVQLGSKLYGVVSLTDINDDWVSNALTGLSPGGYVRARVIAADGAKPSLSAKPSTALVDSKERVVLSLRPSNGGLVAGAADSSAAAVSKQQQQHAATAGFGGPVLQQQQLKVGTKVQGYVRSVSTKGLFVVLDRQHDARIKLSQLSDGFVEDPAAAFPVGARVEGRVVSLEHTKPPAVEGAAAAADDGLRVELSLRSAESSRGVRTIADIKEGELTSGKVRRVEKYGVFVELARSRVSGLVHISQVGQGFVKDLASQYSPGQIVSVRVLSVDKEQTKVSLSMKPELLVGDDSDAEDQDAGGQQRKGSAGKQSKASGDFDDELLEAMQVEESEGQEEGASEGEEGSELSDAADSDDDLDDMDITDEGEEQETEAGEDEAGSEDAESEEQADTSEGEQSGSDSEQEGSESGSDEAEPLLQSAGVAAADWGELQLQDGVEAEKQQTKANGLTELTRGEKKRLKAAREAEIRAAEAARLAGGEQPESVASYEQQLLAEPNSSFLWVKYMAYQLKLGEIDAARKVAERALNTIAMTSERDKFNVWVALMNLENAYGGSNAEDAVMAVFRRAVQYCDPKPLYLALLGILERSRRWQLAGDVWRTATKKFNQSCKVWLGAFESALQAANRAAAAEEDGQPSSSGAAAAAGGGDAAAARQVLERALKSLPKRKHIKALMRAALAEFRLGCAERGRSMFESMLANYPKRTDIWNVYIDQEIKAGDAARTRSLLARATSLSLNPKKMKVLFRRWLEYEQAHGTAADVAAVKQRAVEYMESQALAAGA